MRYAIFSDVHSNLEAFEAVIGCFPDENIDRYLFCGDMVGYGANPGECIQRFMGLNAVAVAGNHEWGSCGRLGLERFTPNAKTAVIWTAKQLSAGDKDYLSGWPLVYAGKTFTIAHGTLAQPQDFDYMNTQQAVIETFKILKTRICFIGHTHVPVNFVCDSEGEINANERAEFTIRENRRYIINVGSVGQPRDEDPRASFCVYDDNENTVCLKRVAYDIIKTQKKIRQAGLPEFLAERLERGK